MYRGSCLVCFCFHASKVCNCARVCVVCGEPQAQTDSSQLASPLPCDCVRQQWATNGTADRHMSCSSSHGHYWGILFTLKKKFFSKIVKKLPCVWKVPRSLEILSPSSDTSVVWVSTSILITRSNFGKHRISDTFSKAVLTDKHYVSCNLGSVKKTKLVVHFLRGVLFLDGVPEDLWEINRKCPGSGTHAF